MKCLLKEWEYKHIEFVVDFDMKEESDVGSQAKDEVVKEQMMVVDEIKEFEKGYCSYRQNVCVVIEKHEIEVENDWDKKTAL